MYQVYTATSTTYNQNQPVTFTTVRNNDCRVTNTANNNFAIRYPGKYIIHFCGVGSSSVATDSFSIQLYKNGVAVPGAITTITSTAASDQQTLSLTTAITVRPSCAAVNNTANLQLMVVSESTGTLYSGDLIISKVQ